MDKKNNLIFENIFFDLDGTLLNNNKEILSSSLDIIKDMQQQGKKISIVTGRPYYFAKEEHNLIKADFPLISCNGSLIYDFKNEKILFQNPINKEASQQVFDLLIKNKITFLVYTTKQMFGFYHFSNSFPKWFSWLTDSIQKRKKENRFEVNFNEYAHNKINNFKIQDHDIIKFLIIKSDSNLKDIEDIEKNLLEIDKIYVLRSQKNVIDIMPLNSSKGEGLKKLAEIFNINLDKSIVFGDEENDISMFQVAKYSVAMGQSKEKIKVSATHQTKSNDEDGIYYFLKNYK